MVCPASVRLAEALMRIALASSLCFCPQLKYNALSPSPDSLGVGGPVMAAISGLGEPVIGRTSFGVRDTSSGSKPLHTGF